MAIYKSYINNNDIFSYPRFYEDVNNNNNNNNNKVLMVLLLFYCVYFCVISFLMFCVCNYVHFCCPMRCISAAYAVMRCLSVGLPVCLSVTFVSCVKTNKGNFFHLRVAKPFYFFQAKRDGDIPTGSSLTGAPNATNATGYEKFTIFDQYLAITQKGCEIKP